MWATPAMASATTTATGVTHNSCVPADRRTYRLPTTALGGSACRRRCAEPLLAVDRTSTRPQHLWDPRSRPSGEFDQTASQRITSYRSLLQSRSADALAYFGARLGLVGEP